ncbi:MAG: hypothetical protein Q8R88_10525 [Desulfoprunum sp.]|nr:hypothetical protein [Desulfoprunum sp.]
MFASDDMKSTNRAVFNGDQIECINFDLETLDNARKTCMAISKTLEIIQTLQTRVSTREERFYGNSEIEEFANGHYVVSGLAAALVLVTTAISNAEENIAGFFEDNLLAQGEDQKSYKYLYKRGQKGQDLEKLPMGDFF